MMFAKQSSLHHLLTGSLCSFSFTRCQVTIITCSKRWFHFFWWRKPTSWSSLAWAELIFTEDLLYLGRVECWEISANGHPISLRIIVKISILLSPCARETRRLLETSHRLFNSHHPIQTCKSCTLGVANKSAAVDKMFKYSLASL